MKGNPVQPAEPAAPGSVASYMEMYANISTELPGQDVFWARMGGFLPWPSRLCSAYEIKQLLQVRSAPKSGQKSYPVTF